MLNPWFDVDMSEAKAEEPLVLLQKSEVVDSQAPDSESHYGLIAGACAGVFVLAFVLSERFCLKAK